MRFLLLVLAVGFLVAAGWQYRTHLGLPHSGGQVGSAAGAERWLRTYVTNPPLRRAHCTASSADVPLPSNFAIPAAIEHISHSAYDCKVKVAGRRVHPWCVMAFESANPVYQNQVAWTAGYATCRSIARADAQRVGPSL
jgi:hypothetical protein